ncbi:MAG: trehalose-6-phosphate synthase [Aquincola sp.]|nr:trehalose-6-phosphate synthase [Aquincola sp.]
MPTRKAAGRAAGAWRFQLRFLAPLLVTLLAAALLALPLMDRMTLRWFSRDLNLRGALVADTLSDSIARAMADTPAASQSLRVLFDRAVRDERLVAVALCTSDGQLIRASAGFPEGLDCKAAHAAAADAEPVWRLPAGSVHVGWHPVASDSGPDTGLVLLHDMSFVDRRSVETRWLLIALIAGMGFVIAVSTVAVAQLSWRGWLEGARALLRGEGLVRPLAPTMPGLAPLADELRARLRDLEDEYRRSAAPEMLMWSPERLRVMLHQQLRDDEVIVVSNREPWLHEHTPDGIVVRNPASGLVTALEPVMRACSGTWVAHGSGSADRQAVDAADRVAVPPDDPRYTLRRVWLSAEEEQGYYYGLANEGLWPLCHVAHVRPVFRESDWRHYREVNERFADAVAQEAKRQDPVILIQDYHFALLPAMLRKQLPKATILTFWHIPWPNPESFGICPWRREIVQGLLGSSILGFHTRYHCKNFLETVDRYLEARIEHEHSSIVYQGAETRVESYPISIAWPTEIESAAWPDIEQCRSHVRALLGMQASQRLAVGVDRFDYTKGILERLNAVERLLEKYPQWIGTFCFVQIAAPTRSQLDEYRSFQLRIDAMVERINKRFGREGYCPVHLLAEHHEHDELTRFYRAADVCVVTSLHDGMNLVSKEFVAARDDEQGALLLSRFAGAARELREALIVNPYHVEETADTLHRALMMSPEEQRERMRSLRAVVRDNNVYRWAGQMLGDAARWRLRERIEARVERHGMEVA